MATDEEVQAAKDHVVELRAQLEDARTGGAEHIKSVENDITLHDLAAEAARLEAELAVAKEQKKVTVVRAGAAAPLSTAKEQMAAAVSHQKSVEKELAANKKTGNQSTPTDAAETNNTTTEQASNKAADKTEGAGK